jgi:acyl transferase domain-containing protein
MNNQERMNAKMAAKMAIVGMDAFFGECDGLDAFESSIYDGKQHFIPLPEKRWHGINEQEKLLQGYGLETGTAPNGAYIKDFEIDTLAYKIPPNEVEKLNPQQTLLLKVCDRALKDGNIQPNSNVAVIIAADTELSVHQLQQRWNSSWQLKDGLNAAEIALPPEKISQLENIVKDSVHHQVELGEYLSYVGNIMASRISSLWNFSGPSFTISAVETATFKALELAEMLLATNEVEAVVVGAVDLAGGVENVLLKNQFGKLNTGINTLSFDQKCRRLECGRRCRCGSFAKT